MPVQVGKRRHTLSSTKAENPSPAGYGVLIWGNANFRFLWFGQIVSLLGDWFNLIASAALIAELTHSGVEVASLFVVRMLAPFLVSPLAGVVADRYNRKRILILTDLTRAVTVFGFLLVRAPQDIWLLYTLTGVQLGISGFFFPTRNAILPDIVSRSELGTANTVSSSTWSVMLALGAALGGIVSGTWGVYPAFVIDALTFLLSASLISRIRYRSQAHLKSSEKSFGAVLRLYLDGLRYLVRKVDILVIALQKAATFSAGYQVIQVDIGRNLFPIGQSGGISLGLLFAIFGLGTGAAPIVVRRWVGDRDPLLRRAIAVGYLLMATGMGVTATLFGFGTVLLGNLLRGVGGGMVWVFSTQLLLQLVPDRVRGRVFATEFAILTLASAAGTSVVGVAVDSSLGISGTLWWMAGLTLIPGILWGLWIMGGRNSKPALDASGSDRNPEGAGKLAD